jgi:hypothetical protein
MTISVFARLLLFSVRNNCATVLGRESSREVEMNGGREAGVQGSEAEGNVLLFPSIF